LTTKEYFPDIWALSDEAASDVWRLAVGVAHRLNEVLDPDGMTLFPANRAAGWHDVFHFHLHVVPRWEGDALVRPWRHTPGDNKRLDDIARRPQRG
jgi:histidine triad (HIT) family protein